MYPFNWVTGGKGIGLIMALLTEERPMTPWLRKFLRITSGSGMVL